MILKPFPLNYDYRVSDTGQIFSIKYGNYLSPAKDKDGYLLVNFCHKAKVTHWKVGRVVLMTWDRLPLEGEEASHLNNDKTDNRLVNLKWMSHVENEGMKEVHGTRLKGIKVGTSFLTEEEVLSIRELAKLGLNYYQIAAKFGIAFQHVGKIVKRKEWRHI